MGVGDRVEVDPGVQGRVVLGLELGVASSSSTDPPFIKGEPEPSFTPCRPLSMSVTEGMEEGKDGDGNFSGVENTVETFSSSATAQSLSLRMWGFDIGSPKRVLATFS